MILPLPEWAIAYRPNWIMLVIVFWIVFAPDGLGITIVWVMGICADLLTGATLGQNAVSFMVCGFIFIITQQTFKLYSMFKQCVVVAVATLLYLGITRWLFEDIPIKDDWTFWCSALSTALLWPWVFVLLREMRRNSLSAELN